MYIFSRKVVPVVLTALLFPFLSCNKDGGGVKQYYVKALVNGTELANTGYAFATFNTIPTVGLNTCTIQSGTSGTSTTNLLGVVIADDAPITLNTYTETAIAGSIQATISYTDPSGVVYSSVNNAIADATITITGLSDSEMSGYFSGTVTPVTGVGDISITNGLFVVPRAN